MKHGEALLMVDVPRNLPTNVVPTGKRGGRIHHGRTSLLSPCVLCSQTGLTTAPKAVARVKDNHDRFMTQAAPKNLFSAESLAQTPKGATGDC